MKPFDVRLLRYASGVYPVLIGGAALGLLRTAAILAWSWALAHLIAGVVGGAPAASLEPYVWLAVAALVTRSAASWGTDTLAERGAIKVKRQLRDQALTRIDELGPEWIGARSDADLAIRLGRGLDALDKYFSGYLPQLLLTAIATPLLLVALFLSDTLSGVTVLLVFPVIPIFMVLIGLVTRGVQQKQWASLTALGRAFLDTVEGLPTLKIFRREERQLGRIGEVTHDYRRRTVSVLRVTFMSGFVLDLAGTLSVALVAVTVGTRLVEGTFPLDIGLFVLLLVPEIFIPIRQVGAAFHASAEGLAASESVFEIIEEPGSAAGAGLGGGAERGGSTPRSEITDSEKSLTVRDLTVRRGGNTIVGPVSFEVSPGEFVALAGPSGAGKSSIIAAILGTAEAAGALDVPSRVAWAGQRPGLVQGTVADNVALGETEPDAALISRALAAAAAPSIAPERVLGASGAGLSGGQAQRVAIARCLYRAWRTDAQLLLLDEPTSALDRAAANRVAKTLRDEATAGRAVLVVSHREELLTGADRVVRIMPAAHPAPEIHANPAPHTTSGSNS